QIEGARERVRLRGCERARAVRAVARVAYELTAAINVQERLAVRLREQRAGFEQTARDLAAEAQALGAIAECVGRDVDVVVSAAYQSEQHRERALHGTHSASGNLPSSWCTRGSNSSSGSTG